MGISILLCLVVIYHYVCCDDEYIFNSTAFIALISIVSLLICRFIAGLHPLIDIVNPASNSMYATNILISGDVESWYGLNIVGTLLFVLLMIITMQSFIAKKKF